MIVNSLMMPSGQLPEHCFSKGGSGAKVPKGRKFDREGGSALPFPRKLITATAMNWISMY